MNTQKTIEQNPLLPRTVSSARIPLLAKLRELYGIFLMRAASLDDGASLDGIFRDLAEYDELLRKHTNLTLGGAKTLEIGFGPCPNRLLALASLGTDVQGVDLEVPFLEGTRREVIETYRRNGFERAFKSVIRFVYFDRRERRRLAAALEKRGAKLQIDPSRFKVHDAVTLELPDRSLDFIFSEDVFEHIPVNGLATLVAKLARWIRSGGLLLVRPCIFTGIAGGHLTEWFPHRVEDEKIVRRSEPWEHLRRRRFQPNGYLNEMTRADYRRIFSRYFDILEERVRHPGLGSKYLNPALTQELRAFQEDELLSNQVLFVLRPNK